MSEGRHHGGPLRDSRTFGAIMPKTLGESTPPSATAGAGAQQRRKARQAPETDIQQRSRRRARQSREYELIWLLLLASLALALHAATAQPRHGTCQALITLTRRSLSVSRALHVLSSCVLCLAPPAVDLLEALGRCVCTRRACCFCLRISRFCCFR